MALLIIGIMLVVIGVVFVFVYLGQKKKMEAISGVETSTAAGLTELCNGVSSEIGKGSFEEISEVKGVIECDNPIQSEIAKESCVYYSATVTRKYEEEYYETNPQTKKRERKIRQGSDTVSSNSRSVPFNVRDDTGVILVNPKEANIDGEKVVDRFEPETSVRGGSISFGGFTLNLSGGSSGSGRRTLGYQFNETILPLHRNVYVLGAASDSSGQLMIQKPKEKGKPFIISLKSEEELLKTATSGMTWSRVGAIACIVIGVVLIILQFVTQ